MTITVALGTSMPTSITVVATSTSTRRSRKAVIVACFSSVVHLPVQGGEPKAGQRPLAEPVELAVARDLASSRPSSSTCGTTTYACRPARDLARG